MDQNMNGLDGRIVGDIRNKMFWKSIHILTQKITNICSNIHKTDGVETLLHYYLLRSYCYYKSGSEDELNLALEDVYISINLDNKRFQPHLLGALILLDMKRWDHSLQMFEKSIEIKSDLFEIFVHKLLYLKFKILTSHGFDEEQSFRSALNYRYLTDCLSSIRNTFEDNDSVVFHFIVNIKNQRYGSETGFRQFFSDINNSNRIYNNMNTNDDDFDRLTQPESEIVSICEQQIQSMVDQTRPMIDRSNNSVKTVKTYSNSNPSETKDNSDIKSIDPQFKDMSIIERQEASKSDTVQNWIETNFSKDSVSRLCSFDDKEGLAPSVAKATSDVTNSDNKIIENQNQNSDVTSVKSYGSSMGSQSLETATNVMKLRGVYIGNLLPKCDQKYLKEVFKKYGTIIDCYHPSGTDYAFVHYKSHDCALKMLNEWKGRQFNQCMPDKRLTVRFIPNREQMQKYHSLTFDDYKKRCNDNHECELWRSGQRCFKGPYCTYKHVPVNRAVDTVPDKRKSHWKFF